MTNKIKYLARRKCYNSFLSLCLYNNLDLTPFSTCYSVSLFAVKRDYERTSWFSSNLPWLVFGRFSIRMSVRARAILIEVFRGFPQSPYPNNIILQLHHKHFLPKSYQFGIILPSYHWTIYIYIRVYSPEKVSHMQYDSIRLNIREKLSRIKQCMRYVYIPGYIVCWFPWVASEKT
jgi:hypothetical protein